MIETIQAWVLTQVNSEIGGGIILASIFGTVIVQARHLPVKLFNQWVRHFTTEVLIQNSDASFFWVNKWLSLNLRKTRRLNLVTDHWDVEEGPGRLNEKWLLTPGYGIHVLWYKFRPILVEKFEEKAEAMLERKENIRFRTLGRSPMILLGIMIEARELTQDTGRLKIHHHEGSYWNDASLRDKRPLQTVVLNPVVKHDIVSHVDWFLSAKPWHHTRGIPYRTGIMLQGTPGTGKSSMVLALATEFNLPVYVLNLDGLLSGSHLASCINSVPEKSILLIEDIDSHTASLKRTFGSGDKDKEKEKVPLSAILNCLDGIQASEGRVLIMTSNHPENLDPALTRSGRIDMTCTLEDLGPREVREMFENFYPDNPIADEVFESLGTWNPATLQGVLLKHKSWNDALVAVTGGSNG